MKRFKPNLGWATRVVKHLETVEQRCCRFGVPESPEPLPAPCAGTDRRSNFDSFAFSGMSLADRCRWLAGVHPEFAGWRAGQPVFAVNRS